MTGLGSVVAKPIARPAAEFAECSQKCDLAEANQGLPLEWRVRRTDEGYEIDLVGNKSNR